MHGQWFIYLGEQEDPF